MLDRLKQFEKDLTRDKLYFVYLNIKFPMISRENVKYEIFDGTRFNLLVNLLKQYKISLESIRHRIT